MAESVGQIYEALRARIVNGSHPAGTRLREATVAATLGVSRTPVREALQRLQADGLVELSPNRGARVTGLVNADIEDIFELRSLLEGYAARRAAECGVHDLGQLTSLCDAMEATLQKADASWSKDITELNMRFHRSIHDAANNALLPRALSGVVQLSLVRHTFDHYTKDDLARSFAQHRELVAAIGQRDGAWAESVMVAHLHAARASLRRHIAQTFERERRAQ